MRPLFYLFGVFFIVLPLCLTAQISRPGSPPSFDTSAGLLEAPVVLMPSFDLQALQTEDLVVDSIETIPWRFGNNIAVDLNTNNSGVWELLNQEGDRIWRLGIRSEGALSINLTFNRYILPPGAELYVYTVDRSVVLGAFTDHNNQDDLYFATTLLPGEEVVIEYFEPATSPFRGELSLETVTHGYRSAFDYAKRFRDSGSCNLNVACEQAKGWENEIDAVIMLLVNNNGFCSGALINNVRHDARPLVLSADHCLRGRNPATMVFWFNWQSETCENPATSPPHNAMSGAKTLARSVTSDFWLLELNQDVPLSYNPYFAGWNRSLQSSFNETIFAIHHPKGDIKKFSYALGGTHAAAYLGNPGSGTTHWHVTWSGGTTTEIGSSGSPLFDGKGRIIGQLHGGYAACGNTLPDWYGRFGYSWDAGQTPATSLASWLDPDQSDASNIYGFRPKESIIHPPLQIEAQATSADSIIVQWTPNSNEQPVLVAFNTSPLFGEPNMAMSVGDTLREGGVVLHLGAGTKLSHHPRLPETTYHYRAWSYNHLFAYSESIVTSATSLPYIIQSLPHQEEIDETEFPRGWTQITNNEAAWKIGTGNSKGNPESAFSGEFNYYFLPGSDEQMHATSLLVSPPVNFDGYDKGRLEFYFSHYPKEENTDILRIYYRLSASGNWLPLDTINQKALAWTSFSVDLPEVSESLQLGFEAGWRGGQGICIDDIRITGLYDVDFPPPSQLTAIPAEQHKIMLQWELPEVKTDHPTAIAHRVFRNGTLIQTISNPETVNYTDSGLAVSTYTYHVTTLYANPPGESTPDTAQASIAAEEITHTLTIQISGNGTTCPAGSTTLMYNHNSPVVAMAQPDSFNRFEGWFEGEQLLTEDSELLLTMDKDQVISAVFAPNEYPLILQSLPAGIGIQTGSGVYSHGNLASISTNVPYGWRFSGWHNGERLISAKTAIQLPVVAPITLTAIFEPIYIVSFTSEPAQGGITRGSGLYEAGDTVSAFALANHGWEFMYWEEGGVLLSADSVIEIEVADNRQINAVFNRIQYEIKASVSPEGAGVITGTGTYFLGDTVALSVSPNDHHTFLSWQEGGETVSNTPSFSFVAERNRQFVAMLEPSSYNLVISIEGNGRTTPAPGTYSHEKGSLVTLSADPDHGWRFQHWVINEAVFTENEVEVAIDTTIFALAVFYFPVSTQSPSPVNKSMVVYPNPGDGLFEVTLEGWNGEVRMNLFNMAGQHLFGNTIYPFTETRHGVTLDLSFLKPGIYLLRVSDQTTIRHKKIILRQ